MLRNLLILMRPKQWYKNTLIFIGLVFSSNLFNQSMWLESIATFIMFCLLSSGLYMINDVLDYGKDKLHPVKKNRPIASGNLNKKWALIFASILIVLCLVVSWLINLNILYICLVFVALNLGYSLGLKKVVILDILIISMDFTIRAIAGCLAINVAISPWITVCAFLLALFLAVNKRRNEIILMGGNAKVHREVLGDYSEKYCDQINYISIGALIISYSLYTFLTGNIWMMITIPIIVYGLLRYLWLVNEGNNIDIEDAIKDKGILISLFSWIILCAIILYK